MSRSSLDLWPAAVEAGLFPGHCWLAKGKKKREVLSSVTEVIHSADLLPGLDQCLVQAQAKLTGRTGLSLVVSDGMAAIALLPWQEGLTSGAELQGYAQICFEKQGHEINADWVMQVQYVRHGAAGLAYALPRDWMQALLHTLGERHMKLDSVLPLSAQAFCATANTTGPGLKVVLLFEANHHAALVFRDGSLLARDIEPFAQSMEKTCRRLLARVLANQCADEKAGLYLDWWSYRSIEFPQSTLEDLAAEVTVTQIADGAWA